MRVWFCLAACALPALAQLPSCSAPLWSPCDLVFPLQPGENSAALEFRAEFRSPHRDTRRIPGFVDGDRIVVRFTPDEAGEWDYRVTSSLARLDGQLGKTSGTASNAPGFLRAANMHHFQTANLQPHLWMGSEVENFAAIPRVDFEAMVGARATEKFTHLRVTLDASTDLREAADRIRVIHDRGLVTDLAFATLPADRRERERVLTEAIARFSAYNLTWAGVTAFEKIANARAVMGEMGDFLARNDPYKHPRTTLAEVSSFGLAEDGWMDLVSYGTPDPNVGAVERQSARTPSVNTGVRSRADLWNATMNGHYPSSGAGREFSAWFDFISTTRYWEMQPFFDVTGGRAIAVRDVELGASDMIDAVEYVVYLEKPGPVEVRVQKQKYDVFWIDPATGQRVKGKEFKEEVFKGTPPDTAHDWVLHLSREGHKEELRKSYKFESRPVRRQQPEMDTKSIPFEVEQPAGEISLRSGAPYRLNTLRSTRATQQVLAVWTAEPTTGGEGGRVVGTGTEGMLKLPAFLANRAPAVMSLRVSILNANGKLYVLDRVFRVVP
jgi:hypothetical protein